MRVAVISDIHGNLVALDAVFADIDREQVDRVVCLGDVSAAGPQPRQVIQRLQRLDLPTVIGNTDDILLQKDELAAELQGVEDVSLRRKLEFWLWGAEQLAEAEKEYLESFKPTVEVPLSGGHKMLCYHGSPRSYDDPILPTTPDEKVEEMLAGHTATVMVGGHTHHQMLRRVGGALVVNPGSVGISSDPVDRWPPSGGAHRASWAEYAIVRSEGDQLGVDLRRVPFDESAVIDAILTSGMPNAKWIAERYR